MMKMVFLVSLSSDDPVVEERKKVLEVILNGQKTFGSYNVRMSSLDFGYEAVPQKWLNIFENI